MSLTPELMRSCVLEALKLRPPEQYINLKIATAGVAGQRGYPVEQQPHGRAPILLREDERRFREVVQALIQEGVLVPGMDESNDAGHPAIGRPVDRDQAFVNLQLFPIYRSWVLSIINLLPI